MADIVIVDGDRALRAALSFSLDVQGFSVTAYPDSEALLAADEVGQCLVIEHRLPGQDGLALIAALRRRGASARAIVTATNPNRTIRQAIAQAGAVLIEKPLIGEGLATAIRAALAEQKAAA